MSASRVHAIVAAALENPALLARWKQEPESLRVYGVDPAAFDLDAIWKFAGLSAKVKHNGLRFDLPLTFRFLSLNGLEIEVFGAYAAHKARAGTRYTPTTEGRIVELVDFLRDSTLTSPNIHCSGISSGTKRRWPNCDSARHE
jgi:hypothetical protein